MSPNLQGIYKTVEIKQFVYTINILIVTYNLLLSIYLYVLFYSS